MTELEALVSLNMVGEIGSIRLKKLLEFFGSPENILKAPVEKLMAVSGIGKEIAHKIRALKKEDLDREFKLAKKLGLKILTQDDADYPENLKNIPDPPIVLYIKGELRPEDKFSLGIVGSRRASFYGLTSAEKFAYDLSQKGFTIVSGMARGVDSAAHKGALKAGGRTIAVIGSGFNHIYPPENEELAEEIAGNGAVVSEFPVNTKPLPQNFPQRNRVISGLSLGILVAEAAQNSGALITADFALEQGREVFALPGKVDSNTSFGTNGLIKQGAKLVSCVEDILEEFDTSTLLSINPERPSTSLGTSPEFIEGRSRRIDTSTLLSINPERPSTSLGTSPEFIEGRSRRIDLNNSIASCVLSRAPKEEHAIRDTQNAKPNLSDTEVILYNAISEQPISLDEIAEKTNLSIPRISDILLKLQLKKLIRQLPGKQFVRS